MAVRRLWIGAAIVVVAIYVLVANDGRHHWHEFRYLYGATFYSTTELMQGVFDPGPAPIRTPEQVAVWYATELFHIYLLNQLVALFGMGLKSYTIIKTLYGIMLVAAVGLVWKTLRDLGMSPGRSALTAGLLLISPMAVYLGFKLMGEVPSFFFSACALTLFTAGIRRTDTRFQALLSGVAGLFLALSMLSSARMPLLFLGFWAALLLVWVPAEMKKPIVRAGMISWTVFLIGAFVIFWLLGGRVDIYYDSMVAFSSFSKALPMWMFAVFNLGLFGMVLWFLVPLACLSPDQRFRRFFLVWLALSALPVLIMAANFLEPRYLATALVPFVGLAALGLEGLWDYLCAPTWSRSLRAVAVSVVAVIVIGGAAFAQPLMPYESDTNRLIQAVESEAPRPESAVILVPWNYSDFHFLRFAFPDRPIYLVQLAANERGETVEDPIWTHHFAEMYGNRYLVSAAAVPPEFFQRKLLYVGWTILPSLENLHELFMTLGLMRLAGYFEASRFRNHMTESWLVNDSRFAMREIARYGQYQVYEVRSRKFPEPPTDAAAGEVVSSQRVPRWGMFETVFHNDKKYADPFVDTELEATFVSPSGSTYHFFGFYDGDGNGGQSGEIWKLRFMCTEVGTWRWSGAFTDGTPGGSGSFQCVRSSLAGPLEVDKKHPRWLRQANGKHFFPRWYYLQELLFTKEGLWQQDVEMLLVRNGYNMVTVLMMAAQGLLSDKLSRRSYEHPLFYPWRREARTVLWNTPDLFSWNKLDRVLQYLQERGIYVYFFDGFFPNTRPRFPDDPVKETLHLRYALARIGAYWNVTHNITFEFSEFMSTSRLNRIGRYIRQIDPFKLLLTAHDTQDFPGLVQRESWLDFANLQYREGTAATADTSNGFVARNFYGKPISATEMVWEGGDKLNADQVRQGAWGILTGGGFFLYGEFNLGGKGVGEFGAGKAHPFLRIMLDFMERIPYWTMSPHNELVEKGSFCLANPGKEYVVYMEKGGVVTVDLSLASGSLSIQWLNPRTGELSSAGTVQGGGPQSFTPPLTSEGDWVLHLAGSNQTAQRTGYGTPLNLTSNSPRESLRKSR